MSVKLADLIGSTKIGRLWIGRPFGAQIPVGDELDLKKAIELIVNGARKASSPNVQLNITILGNNGRWSEILAQTAGWPDATPEDFARELEELALENVARCARNHALTLPPIPAP